MPYFFTTKPEAFFKDFVGISAFGHIVFLLTPYKNYLQNKIFLHLPSLFKNSMQPDTYFLFGLMGSGIDPPEDNQNTV